MGQFLKFFGRRGGAESPKQSRRRQPHRRSLSIEPLEQRRLLAITVDTLADEADGSIVDGDISLRDAVALAPAGETINFAPALTAGGPAKINLTLNAITIAKALTISGPGADKLTLDASINDMTPNVNDFKGHRILIINDGTGALQTVTLEGMTLTGADATGFGGAISAGESLTLHNMVIRDNYAGNGAGVATTGPLSIFDSVIEDNTSTNAGAGIHLAATAAGTFQVVRTTVRNNEVTTAGRGGGIYASVPGGSSFRVTDSAILNNDAPLDGGGIFTQGPLIVTNSAILGNHADVNGGGIKTFNALTVDGSLIDGNSAASGGGIHADAITTLRTSTISNNVATGNGGGVVTQNASANWTQVTISGNRANGSGGGVYATLTFAIHHGTIVNNRADFDAAGGGTGGGIHYTLSAGTPVALDHAILAANLHGASTGDDAVGPMAATFSLIGIDDSAGLSITDNGGNIRGTIATPKDPLLAPLAANDGPVLRGSNPLLTHSPLVGSPVLDAGNPAAIAGTAGIPILDERGTGFTRVYNATGLTLPRIDIGAIELQPSALVGDYNFNGIVDAADYTVWRNTINSTTDKRADGNRDGAVNMDDFSAWKTHYGETLAMSAAAAASGGSLPLALTSSDDAAHDASPGADTTESPAAGLANNVGLGLLSDSERAAPVATESQSDSPDLVAVQTDRALLVWLALAFEDNSANKSSAAGEASTSATGDNSIGGLGSLDTAFAGLGAGL